MFFEWAAEGAKIGVEVLFAIVVFLMGIGAVLAIMTILIRVFGTGGNEDDIRRM